MDSFNAKLTRIETAKNNIKQSIINKGIQVGDNIEDYSEAINNIESSSGDVKLFETVEEMNTSTGNQEGDLALVYRTEITNCGIDSTFSKCIFPKTVVLSEAVTDYISFRFTAVDSSQSFDCMSSFNDTTFMMDCWFSNGNFNVNYSSSDGITYTRTRLSGSGVTIDEDNVDFGIELKPYSSEWNEKVGYFVQIPSSIFGGLFKYESVFDNYEVHTIDVGANINHIRLPEYIGHLLNQDVYNYSSGYNTIVVMPIEISNNVIIKGYIVQGWLIYPAIKDNKVWITSSIFKTWNNDKQLQIIEFDSSLENPVISNTILSTADVTSYIELGTDASNSSYTFYGLFSSTDVIAFTTVDMYMNTYSNFSLYYYTYSESKMASTAFTPIKFMTNKYITAPIDVEE